MIAMAYIADCFTFNRNIDLETFNVNRERNKMIDLLLALLKFKWTYYTRLRQFEEKRVAVSAVYFASLSLEAVKWV